MFAALVSGVFTGVLKTAGASAIGIGVYQAAKYAIGKTADAVSNAVKETEEN